MPNGGLGAGKGNAEPLEGVLSEEVRICPGLVQKKKRHRTRYTRSSSNDPVLQQNVLPHVQLSGAASTPSASQLKTVPPPFSLNFLGETLLFTMEAFQKLNCPVPDPNLVTLFIGNWP